MSVSLLCLLFINVKEFWNLCCFWVFICFTPWKMIALNLWLLNVSYNRLCVRIPVGGDLQIFNFRLISTTGAWLLVWHSSKLQVKEVAREKSNGYYLINLPKNLNVFHWNIVDLNYYYYYFDNNVLSAFLLSFKYCKFRVIWRFFFFF